MFNIALKSLLSHKLRMFLTAFSIILGVSFISGTFVFTDSIGKTFDGLFEDVFEGIDLTVRREAPEFGFDEEELYFDESYLATVLENSDVRIASPTVDGYAQFINKEGAPIGGAGPPTLGFSWTEATELNVLTIKEGNGRPPQAMGEVVMDVNTATNNDFIIGDTVAVQSIGPIEEFEIVGLASFGSADSLAGATLAVFELAEAQRLFGAENSYSSIEIKLAEGIDVAQVQPALEDALPGGIELVTGDEQTQETQNDINEGLGFINTALLVFAGVAVFVGAFIIQNTFRIVITQRSKELALLRAIGATRKQIIWMVLLEAFVIGVLASVIGIVVGFGVAEGIRAAGNAAGLGLPDGEFSIVPRTIIASMSVGVFVTMASALAPAIKASRVSPVEALSDNEHSAKRKSLRTRGLVSIVVALVGAGLLVLGLFGDIASPLYYVGAGVLIMFIGIAAFAPLLSGVLAQFIGWPFKKLRGMPGLLAQENVKRTPRRTASTASALMIGVSLVALFSIFAASVNATVDELVAKSFPADLIALPDGFAGPSSSIPRQFGEDLAVLSEISVVSQIKYDQAKVNGDVTFIAAVEGASFQQVIKLEPSEGAYEALDAQDGVMVRSTLADEKGWVVGDSINIDFGVGSELSIEIVGTFDTDFDSKFIFTRTLYESIKPSTSDTFVSANYVDGIDPDDARAAVNVVGEQYPTVSIQNQSELVAQQKEMINGLVAGVQALLGFAIIIAVLGITNTLALSIAERTRELGLLRAIGMTRRQVRTMVRTESIIIALFGATLGIALGIFFAWAVLKALESEGLTEFVVPGGEIAVYYVLAAIAGVVASIWPAWRAARINVLEALTFE